VTLAGSIEAQQWNDRTLWRPDGSTMFDPVTPLRFERTYAGVLCDEIVLAPDHRDPQRATITLRRRIRIPWWQEWSLAGFQDAEIAEGAQGACLSCHRSALEMGVAPAK
jgi:hypothetical protein